MLQPGAAVSGLYAPCVIHEKKCFWDDAFTQLAVPEPTPHPDIAGASLRSGQRVRAVKAAGPRHPGAGRKHEQQTTESRPRPCGRSGRTHSAAAQSCAHTAHAGDQIRAQHSLRRAAAVLHGEKSDWTTHAAMMHEAVVNCRSDPVKQREQARAKPNRVPRSAASSGSKRGALFVIRLPCKSSAQEPARQRWSSNVDHRRCTGGSCTRWSCQG